MAVVLLTGGLGYIGSHTAVELMDKGTDVVIADDLSNSDVAVLKQIEKITGRRPLFYQADITKQDELEVVFAENKIDAVIHFAGYKAVGESVKKPIEYYHNNLVSTLNLLNVMREHQVTHLVFSSSASVYGTGNVSPLSEEMMVGNCTNPYGWTKYMIERILMDAARADETLSVVLLRYFNPIGAHESGLIGEKPNGIPNNLMPYITQVAAGALEKLSVFGNDYPTSDGTGVRDYIHVTDLARGHVAALEYANSNPGVEVINLGTGQGYSVLQLVSAFERVNNVMVPYEIVSRREGDLAECYADVKKAERLLGWRAEKNLEDMCRDAWRWQQNICKVFAGVEGDEAAREAI